jgi:hypothetical protein
MAHKKYGIEKTMGGKRDVGIIVFESNYKDEVVREAKVYRRLDKNHGYRIKIFPKYMRKH